MELSGEIDMLTAPCIGARLDVLTARPLPDLVVDLRSVSFIDCTGLGVLCRVANHVRARQGRLRLVTDNPRFRRILRLTRLSGAFEVCAVPPGLRPCRRAPTSLDRWLTAAGKALGACPPPSRAGPYGPRKNPVRPSPGR